MFILTLPDALLSNLSALCPLVIAVCAIDPAQPVFDEPKALVMFTP
jgi:hypothetical protein